MQQFVQIALLIAALVVGVILIRWQGPAAIPDTVADEEPALEMLSFIESQIADQEDVKDVRCWSSVNKIQTFLSGLPVELEANSRRIELYVELIEDLWRESAQGDGADEIAKSDFFNVLKGRFPENVREEDGKVKFDFGGRLLSALLLDDAIKDYSDTIESWRLLQSWALRKASQNVGSDSPRPVAVFSHDSLEQFRDFLVVFDIALLKSAKDVAMERKRSSIDAETMTIAFHRLTKGEPNPLKGE